MLINAQRPEELRVAIVSGTVLESFQVDVAESGLTRGNIYRGTIASIQPSLNAAFIDYGTERHGFLSIQDVVPQAYYHDPASGHPKIDEVLDRGKPIVVQVSKDSVGTKGAVLTTNLSLAGRYLVLTPFDDTRGVSRKVEDDETRKKLKSQAAKLALPDGCGVIVRTNALAQTKVTLSRDLAALLRLWKRVMTEATHGRGNRLLYSDQDLLVQALRDHLEASIEEVLVDDDDAYERAYGYMQAFMPRGKTQLLRYAERLPLFSRYEVEGQIDRMHERKVPLPSGGSIVIDPTEALTAIDVNSGRSTRAATQEDTALNTNLEAAKEVARQLRMRDIGGLVVVDFIDMRASRSQRKVEKLLKDAMKDDKARSSVGRISENGLLEINRQRIRQALAVRTHRPCPTCAGLGSIASPEMVGLNVLRRIEARAASGLIEGVRISLHPELADALQNGRRQELAELEREFDIRIEILATPGLHRAEEKIEWLYREKPAAPKPARPQRAERPVLRAADLATASVRELPVLEPEEDLEDEEDEEEGDGASSGSAQGESGEGGNKRKRRRKRKKGKGTGEGTAAPAGPERPERQARPERRERQPRQERQPRAAASAGGGRQPRQARTPRPVPAEGVGIGGDALPDNIGNRVDPNETHAGNLAGMPHEAGAEGGGPRKKRRSRRRRGGKKPAGGAGTGGESGAGGENGGDGGDFTTIPDFGGFEE
jgi:ribonuclease E